MFVYYSEQNESSYDAIYVHKDVLSDEDLFGGANVPESSQSRQHALGSAQVYIGS